MERVLAQASGFKFAALFIQYLTHGRFEEKTSYSGYRPLFWVNLPSKNFVLHLHSRQTLAKKWIVNFLFKRSEPLLPAMNSPQRWEKCAFYTTSTLNLSLPWHLKMTTMHFEKNTVYHIYNQGNNRQTTFFKPDNYLFFLRKMRAYVLPYGDLLCYCLMPNHFHWLMYVRETEIAVSDGVTSSHPVTTRQRSLNESIGILLRSYTRAINKQEGRSGALFREETKAKDGWDDFHITLTHPDYGKVWRNWEIYGATAFNYIHQNPTKAKLVDRAEDWPYSSAPDFAGLRNGTLCNQALAKELLFLI